jgi:hypothetical protein
VTGLEAVVERQKEAEVEMTRVLRRSETLIEKERVER